MSAPIVDTERGAAGGHPGTAPGTRPTSGWLAPTPPSVAIEIASRRVTIVELGAGPRRRHRVGSRVGTPAGLDAVTPALGARISRTHDRSLKHCGAPPRAPGSDRCGARR